MTTIDHTRPQSLSELWQARELPRVGPCPTWCTLPSGHPWDGLHSPTLASRGHQGPDFGEYVSAGSREYDDKPEVQVYDVCISPDVEPDVTTAARARELAGSLIAAAEWLEAQR